MGSGGGVHEVGGFDAEGDDLGADAAGGGAFLDKPAAVGANPAGRQGLNHGGKQLDETCRQAAVGTVEVATGLLLTGRGDAEDLGGIDRRGESEEFAGHGHRSLEPGDARIFGSASNDAKGDTALHPRLRAGAHDRPWICEAQGQPTSACWG
jgi:hypothetical protein